MTKKNSSILLTRIHKIKYNNLNNKTKKNNSNTNNIINNINSNNDNKSNSSVIHIKSDFTYVNSKKKKKYPIFLSKIHTLRRMKRYLPEDEYLIDYIDDNIRKLRLGFIIKDNILNKYIFINDKLNCICENIYTNIKNLEKCNCTKHITTSSLHKKENVNEFTCYLDNIQNKNIKKYKNTKKNKHSKNSKNSKNSKYILKVFSIPNAYIKLIKETNNYIFLESDNFTIQSLINLNICKELPFHIVNIINAGICTKNNKSLFFKNNDKGYILIEDYNLGNGKIFLNNILDGKYDKELNITNEDKKYILIINFLLQIIFIIGHLQSSKFEFLHGNYILENIVVKKCNTNIKKYFYFNIFGKTIKLKNIGFVVLITNLNNSSITLNSYLKKENKNYRILSHSLFKPIIKSYFNNIIKKYDYFDLYIFFIDLVNTTKIRNYVIDKKLDKTIMSFMSSKFKDNLFLIKNKNKTKNSEYKNNEYNNTQDLQDILNKVKEPLDIIFTNNYLNILKNVNYKLFRT
jgi:hypothetical protein